MTYYRAALAILSYAERPLSVAELTSIAVAQALVHPRGQTPDRSMSSVLYRRMARDADAPIISEDGRFWLRDRPQPEHNRRALRPAVRQVHRQSTVTHRDAANRAPRRPSFLPPPLFAIPAVPVDGAWLENTGSRHEKHVARLAAALRRQGAAQRAAATGMPGHDAERNWRRSMAPLLTALGYRRIDQQPLAGTRTRCARYLLVHGATAILAEGFHAGHALTAADAWPTIARARASAVNWVLLTNGRELRLYSVALAGSTAQSSGAEVLRIANLFDRGEGMGGDVARRLWLLSRVAVTEGALEHYLAARVVGAALLEEFKEPGSALAQALADAVTRSTGLRFSSLDIARQARLAVRGARGRDGEPMPGEIGQVAHGRGEAPAMVPEQVFHARVV